MRKAVKKSKRSLLVRGYQARHKTSIMKGTHHLKLLFV